MSTPSIAPPRLSLKRYRTLLSAYLLPFWRLAVVLFVLLFSGITLELLIPQILRNFIDTAHNGGSIRLLTTIAVLFLVVAVGAQLVSVGETYAAENLGWKATNQLRADLALHCLRLDPSFHNAHTPGELIERIDGDVQTLSTFFSQFVIYVLSNVVLLAGVIVMLYRVDWRVGLAGTVITALSLVIIGRLREFASPLWREARQASADLMGFIEERVSGTEDIRSSGATDYTMLRLHQRSRTLLQRTRWASLMGSVMAWATILMFTVGTAVSLGLGAYLFQGGAITIGTVYLIFSYTQMLNNPIEEITRQLSAFQQAAASVTRIQGLLDTQSAIVDGRGTRIPTGALSIELDGVSFWYGDDSPVLRDLSLRVEPGSVLGVLGRTGSGKTTLSRLIFRLYDPAAWSGAAGRDGRARRAGARRADRRWHGDARYPALPCHRAGQPDVLRRLDTGRRVREVLEDLGLWEWCARPAPGAGYQAGGRCGGPLRRARRSCWRSPASSSRIPALSSWMKPHLDSIPPRSGASSMRSIGCWTGGPESSSLTACTRCGAPTTSWCWRKGACGSTVSGPCWPPIRHRVSPSCCAPGWEVVA